MTKTITSACTVIDAGAVCGADYDILLFLLLLLLLLLLLIPILLVIMIVIILIIMKIMIIIMIMTVIMIIIIIVKEDGEEGKQSVNPPISQHAQPCTNTRTQYMHDTPTQGSW